MEGLVRTQGSGGMGAVDTRKGGGRREEGFLRRETRCWRVLGRLGLRVRTREAE